VACLQEDLRQAGIDPAQLDRVADRSMAGNLLALREGRVDAAQLFEPVVEEALASGASQLWHVASERGRTSYTAFVTTRDRLVANAEPLLRMVRAIHRTQKWIHACSAAQLAATVSPFFPALDSGVLTGAIARYQAQGVWGARDPSRRRFQPFAKQPRIEWVHTPTCVLRSLRRQSLGPAGSCRLIASTVRHCIEFSQAIRSSLAPDADYGSSAGGKCPA
jgi:ABC-type nitrate/sulfonate/bicarbonate transport system substrate-binding protein